MQLKELSVYSLLLTSVFVLLRFQLFDLAVGFMYSLP